MKNKIIAVILVILSLITGTIYFLENPINPTCEDLNIFFKIFTPFFIQLCFSVFLWLLFGLGMQGYIKPKTVWFIGLILLITSTMILFMLGEIKPSGKCPSFVLPGIMSISIAFICFAISSAVLNNSFEKLRFKNQNKNREKQLDIYR